MFLRFTVHQLLCATNLISDEDMTQPSGYFAVLQHVHEVVGKLRKLVRWNLLRMNLNSVFSLNSFAQYVRLDVVGGLIRSNLLNELLFCLMKVADVSALNAKSIL